MPVNPFLFSGPLKPESMIDRDREATQLAELAAGGHWVRVEAPRRYGKTTLLRRVLSELDEMSSVLVDLEGVLSLGAIVVRIERAYSAQLKGRLRRFVDSVFRSWDLGLSLGAVGFALELKNNPTLDSESILLRLLALPEELYKREGSRTLIVFDEVQDLLRVPGADGIIRSVIQHQQDAATYAFAGSAPSLMSRLFEDPSAPLLEQAVALKLEPLARAETADYVITRFENTGRDPGSALDPLLNFARGHPQRLMLLAHQLWELTPQDHAADEQTWITAQDKAMEHAEPALRATWSAWPLNDQRAAQALATSPSEPRNQGTLALVGLAPGSAHASLKALQGRGDAIEGKYGLHLTDPLLEHWLKHSYVSN